MNLLFVIQGEGRGHFTQAITLYQKLKQQGHTIDKILIGKSKFRPLPDFVKKTFGDKIILFDSPNFLPSKRKTHIIKSILYNLIVNRRYWNAVKKIKKEIENTDIDKVINFYEPLAGLAYKKYNIDIPMICIAHQYTFLHPDYQFPKRFFLRKIMLKKLTRITCQQAKMCIGLSLSKMNDIPQQNLYIAPPLIRSAILNASSQNGDYIHGYFLNDGFLQDIEKQNFNTNIQLFIGKNIKNKNPKITIYPIDEQDFIKSFVTCKAFLCTAGFESIAEAMWLHKPTMVVAVNFEQKCNAFEAFVNQAAIYRKHFDIQQLLNFANHYQPNNKFCNWVSQESDKIVHLIESC